MRISLAPTQIEPMNHSACVLLLLDYAKLSNDTSDPLIHIQIRQRTHLLPTRLGSPYDFLIVEQNPLIRPFRLPRNTGLGLSDRGDVMSRVHGWTFVGNESFQAVVGRNLAAPTDVALLVTSRRCRGSSVLPGVIGVGEQPLYRTLGISVLAHQSTFVSLQSIISPSDEVPCALDSR